MITVPSYLYDNAFQRRLQHMCDAVVEIESFAGNCAGAIAISQSESINQVTLSHHFT